MYDQNPMLHKLPLEDLAREYEALRKPRGMSGGLNRFATVTVTLTAVIAAVFVIGANVV